LIGLGALAYVMPCETAGSCGLFKTFALCASTMNHSVHILVADYLKVRVTGVKNTRLMPKTNFAFCSFYMKNKTSVTKMSISMIFNWISADVQNFSDFSGPVLTLSLTTCIINLHQKACDE
jgi:hypothetical protein